MIYFFIQFLQTIDPLKFLRIAKKLGVIVLYQYGAKETLISRVAQKILIGYIRPIIVKSMCIRIFFCWFEVLKKNTLINECFLFIFLNNLMNFFCFHNNYSYKTFQCNYLLDSISLSNDFQCKCIKYLNQVVAALISHVIILVVLIMSIKLNIMTLNLIQKQSFSTINLFLTHVRQ